MPNSMQWTEWTVTITATLLVCWALRDRVLRPHRRARLLIAVLLVGIGLQFFPLQFQAYDATAAWWHLSNSQNYVLWYTISTPLIVGGVLLFGKPRRRSL